MFFCSIKGMNRLVSKEMSNIYSRVTIEKTDVLNISIFKVDIAEFSKLLLQLKN